MAKLIELIQELKNRTGAGLMDCKHALVENGEDIEKAIVWLREKGIAKQAKKEGRIAAEGLTLARLSEDGKKAVILEINSETDFVAKSDPFADLMDKAANIILAKGIKTLEALKEDAEFKEIYDAACLKLGEKISVRRFEVVEAGDATLAYYIHMKGKISVLVMMEGGNFDLGKEVAMNIAANSPAYVSKEDISTEAIAKETEIQLALTKEQDPKFANKPEEIQHKIISGKVNKILFEQVLSEEALIKNPDMTVGQLLAKEHAKVLKFVRYQVGEGIQKREDNFAEEVMAQAK